MICRRITLLTLQHREEERGTATDYMSRRRSSAAHAAEETPRRMLPRGALLGGVFTVGERLGVGSFGEVYVGTAPNTEWDDQDGDDFCVAIKTERADSPHRLLPLEHKVYRCLETSPGFPRVWWYGRCVGGHRAMAMTLMGTNLEDAARMSDASGRGRMPTCVVAALAVQMITRIEALHACDYVHRDIKPENFMFGRTHADCGVVHLIDMGLAKRYRRPKHGGAGRMLVVDEEDAYVHIPYETDKQLTGTPRYASVHAHAGTEQSRRDDIEALGYVLVYLLRGRLPWQGVSARDKETKYRMIYDIKRRTTVDALCAGFPRAFADYFRYCRTLYFEDRPDYERLRNMFAALHDVSGLAMRDAPTR